ncbi:MAG: glucuronate isomerase [Cytophagaceae bacterium]|nr:glucuronate isomerase [Cytophagaceae bacterium]
MRKSKTVYKEFIHEDFLLSSEAARILYHEYARQLPVIDYHSHISAKDLAEDRQFTNITELWLEHDHYKWRAMRANGVDEKYCTGDTPPKEKFIQWASTVPYALKNPLYHWTHLELKRYFGIDDLLNKNNAEYIYDKCNEMLKGKEFSARNLLAKMNVEILCTTDDPADSLQYHKVLQDAGVRAYPTFRPDKALALGNVKEFQQWLYEFEKTSQVNITSFKSLLQSLKNRIEYFASLGCRISDHGLSEMYAEDFTEAEAEKIFLKLRSGDEVNEEDKKKYASAVLFHLGQYYHEIGWVQQFHLGAIRNNRTKYFEKKGPDLGFDSIGDRNNAQSLSRFLDKLDSKDKLGKTILYNLNPSDNEVFATMLANFNDGKIKGKMQLGPAWWFLDQKEGITNHLNAVSNFGLLAHFVGMVTDSRSLLSFPRHEYFRRILCDVLGNDIENGELPEDIPMIGKMVQNICYHNSKNYFNF